MAAMPLNFIPWVCSVEGAALRITPKQLLPGLLPLLGAVVMRLTKRLPIALIPKQSGVAPMGGDVINDGCRNSLALLLAHDTKGMTKQVGRTCFLPPSSVASLMCVRPGTPPPIRCLSAACGHP